MPGTRTQTFPGSLRADAYCKFRVELSWLSHFPEGKSVGATLPAFCLSLQIKPLELPSAQCFASLFIVCPPSQRYINNTPPIADHTGSSLTTRAVMTSRKTWNSSLRKGVVLPRSNTSTRTCATTNRRSHFDVPEAQARSKGDCPLAPTHGSWLCMHVIKNKCKQLSIANHDDSCRK